MTLTPISQIRRRELMDAALTVLETQGVAGATLDQVARKAGASKGIVLHYFANKQDLFEQTMRYANRELASEVVARMCAAQSPEERLWAVIGGNFRRKHFLPNLCQAWLALCSEVPRGGQFQRLQLAMHARMHSNLVSCLRHWMDRQEAQRFALSLSSLIDGLWLRCALNPGGIDRDGAIAIMLEAIRSRIPHYTVPDVSDDAGRR